MSTPTETIQLSTTGTVWSYTDARYQPPPPFVAPSDPYEPYVIAAVEFDEGLVVLGQMVAGTTVDDIEVGDRVRIVVEGLFSDEEGERLMWRWAPDRGAES